VVGYNRQQRALSPRRAKGHTSTRPLVPARAPRNTRNTKAASGPSRGGSHCSSYSLPSVVLSTRFSRSTSASSSRMRMSFATSATSLTFRTAGNRLSQDATWQGIRTLTNWSYDAADQLMVQNAAGQLTTFQFDAAGNQQEESAPEGRTTYAWNQENRLLEIALPGGERNTMSYRADGLRFRLSDSEGDRRMVWDSQGSSGYQDLLEENVP